VDQICGYRWDLPRLRQHLLDLSTAMSQELDVVTDAAPAGSRPLATPPG
jgi:hypothetical protein